MTPERAPRVTVSTATATAHIRVQASGPLLAKELLKTPRQLPQSWLDRWYWPVVLVASVLLAMCTRLAMHRGAGAAGAAQGVHLPAQQELSLFEQQLYGCRTFKAQPVPYVDTNASLRVVDTYTPEQRKQAEAFTAAVGACTDFACLRKANQLPRGPGQFRFPHYMVLGFPKCATTSIYCHLIQHPQVQYAKEKESHILMDKCDGQLSTCSAEVQREYLEVLNLQEASQAQFTKAAFDGSTHYAQEAEWLAEQLAAEFPWVKVVISMRDPISQALAMFLHNLGHNRTAACYEKTGHRVYSCVMESLEDDKRVRYGPKIEQWMKAFPKREQLQLVQYESLISKATMSGDLQALKSFLQMDEHLPSDRLPLTNWKHMRGDPNAVGRYWNMTRTEYEDLVDVARRTTKEVVKLLDKHGQVDQEGKVAWTRNWERVWKQNLDENCEEGPAGNCKIVVS